MGFAERGGDGILAGIKTAAGKCDLSGVGAQMLSADGQDDAGLGPVGDRDQHRGRNIAFPPSSARSPCSSGSVGAIARVPRAAARRASCCGLQ